MLVPQSPAASPASVSRTAAEDSRRHYFVAALALGLLTLLAFSNSFSTGFALDNQMLLLRDTRIQTASASNIALIVHHTYWWPNGESGLYRPFTTFSYLLNYAILGNGNHPSGYHWINFLLHVTNVLLLFALILRLMDQRTAFFIALLWAVHPVLTESVTNMVGRADLLAGLAVLSGFFLYLKSTETSGWRRSAWLAGVAVTTAIGVFSKESRRAPGCNRDLRTGLRETMAENVARLPGDSHADRHDAVAAGSRPLVVASCRVSIR